MSLINEALKQAEEEKLENSPDAGDAVLLPPVERKRRLPSASLAVKLILGVVLVVAGIAAYRVWSSGRYVVPKTAAASTSRRSAKAKKSKRSKKAKAAKKRQARSKAGKTAETSDKKTATITPSAQKTKQPTPGIKPKTQKPITKPAPAAVRPETKIPAIPAKPSQPQKPLATGPRPDASKYKVSGIMVGPNGPTAILNGRCVQVGERVGRAKVVKITQYVVILDISGHIVTVGM